MSSWFRSTPKSEELLEQERLVVAAIEAIAEAMERRGINKKQLANLLDVRPSEISQRMSGQRNLTLKSLATMLHALGVRARLSIEDEGERFVAREPWTSTNVSFQRTDIGPVVPQILFQVGSHDWLAGQNQPIRMGGFGQVAGAPVLTSMAFGLPEGNMHALMGSAGEPTVIDAVTEVSAE